MPPTPVRDLLKKYAPARLCAKFLQSSVCSRPDGRRFVALARRKT
jgi:hypothetical protein